MVINAWPQLDFLDLDHLLSLAGLGSLLLFQKAELAIIQDFANRRLSSRHDFDEIKRGFFCQLQCLVDISYTAIFALCVDELNLSDADFLIGAVAFLGWGRRCLVRTANGRISLYC